MVTGTADTNPPMTTISIRPALRKRLEQLKVYPRETMDDVIQRLLDAQQKASP